jgi:hypothetical protein
MRVSAVAWDRGGGYDARWEIGGANAQELAGVVSLGSWILLARA